MLPLCEQMTPISKKRVPGCLGVLLDREILQLVKILYVGGTAHQHYKALPLCIDSWAAMAREVSLKTSRELFCPCLVLNH